VVKKLRDMEKDSIKINPSGLRLEIRHSKIYLWAWRSGSGGRAPA
jgi:hypothetical protein